METNIVEQKKITQIETNQSRVKTPAMNTQLKQRMAFAFLMGLVTTGIISFILISITLVSSKAS